MRKIHYYLYICIGLLLTACTEGLDTSFDLPEDSKTYKVSVRVNAAGTEMTKADEEGFNGDPNAREGEFIHSLHVFIVDEDENKIEAEWTLEEGMYSGDQAKGNVVNWQSPDIDITEGPKRIYAFANMEDIYIQDYEVDFDQLLEGVKAGMIYEYFEEGKLSAVRLTNPAGLIDLKNHFIPMSCVELHDFNTDIIISLALIRMVSRIDISVLNNRKDNKQITVRSIKFSHYSEDVSLVSSYVDKEGNMVDHGVAECDNPITPSAAQWNDENGIEVAVTKEEEICSFYVNETNLGDGKYFEIELETSEGTLKGVTSKSLLPRNTVYPLRLTFDVSLGLDVAVWLTPVGGYPRSLTIASRVQVGDGGDATSKLSLTLPEGCMFTLTPKLSGMTAKTWTWKPGTNVAMNSAADAEVFDGNMTGVVGATGTITLTVDEGKDTENTFTIEITTEAIKDWSEYDASTNALLRWCAAPQCYEPVSIVREK